MAITVTATASTGTSVYLLVQVLAGAREPGGASVEDTSAGHDSLTPAFSRSLPLWAVFHRSATATFTAEAANTILAQGTDATNTAAYGFGYYSAATVAGTAVTAGCSSSPGSGNNFACYELPPSGASVPVISAASPAVAVAATADHVTTASFTPAPGSVLAAMVSVNVTSGTPAMTVTDSSGMTWTLRESAVVSGQGGTWIYTATVASGGTGVFTRSGWRRWIRKHSIRRPHLPPAIVRSPPFQATAVLAGAGTVKAAAETPQGGHLAGAGTVAAVPARQRARVSASGAGSVSIGGRQRAALSAAGAGSVSIGGRQAGGAAASGAGSVGEPGQTGLLIPLYDYPGQGTATPAWASVIAAASRVRYVVANPASGPGSSADPNYTAVITACRAAGITVLGYVDTDYGAVSLPAVQSGISLWDSLYGVTSVFFDRTSSLAGEESYYATACSYAAGTTVLNCGTIPDEGYAAIGDVITLFEDPYSGWSSFTPPSWLSSYPASHFSVLVYDATQAQMTGILAQLPGYGIGLAEVTDEPDDNFDTLPSYFAALAASASSVGAVQRAGTHLAGAATVSPGTLTSTARGLNVIRGAGVVSGLASRQKAGAAVTGAGHLASAVRQLPGARTLAGAGTVSPGTLTPSQHGIVAPRGAGSLTAGARQRVTATLTGAGHVTAAGITRLAALTLAGAGHLAAAAAASARAVIAGAGRVTAIAPGSARAVITGAGLVHVAGSAMQHGTATMAGAGTMATAGRSYTRTTITGAGAVTLINMQSGAMPAYILPDDPQWTTLLATAGALPSIIILNPDNGLAAFDSTWQALAKQLHAAGITLLGYIYTSYGDVSLADAEASVANYVAGGAGTQYGVDGIFMDEFDPAAGNYDYYASLTANIQAQWTTTSAYQATYATTYPAAPDQVPLIWANPGTAVDSSYLALPVDTFVTAENSETGYLGNLPAWNVVTSGVPSSGAGTYGQSRFASIIYGVPATDITAIIDQAYASYAGYAYVTSSTLPNPYDVLPTVEYLDTEATYARSEPQAVPAFPVVPLAAAGSMTIGVRQGAGATLVAAGHCPDRFILDVNISVAGAGAVSITGASASAAGMRGASVMNAPAGVQRPGAALAGAGHVTPAGHVRALAGASMAGAGTFSGAARQRSPVMMTAAGSFTSPAGRTTAGAAPGAAGAVAASPARLQATAALAGAGHLAAAPAQFQRIGATLTGTGRVIFPPVTATASFAGAGAVGAFHAVAAPLASLAGAGAVTAAPSQHFRGIALIAGAGKFTVAPVVAALSAAGEATVSGSVRLRAPASAAGAGTVSAAAATSAVVSLHGAGILGPPAVRQVTPAALAGASSVTAISAIRAVAKAHGTGIVTGTAAKAAVAGVAGVSALSAPASLQPVIGVIAGAGVTTAEAGLQAVAFLPGAGTLTARQSGGVTAAGAGILTASGEWAAGGSAAGTGTLTVLAMLPGGAQMAGAATLTATLNTAVMAGRGMLTAALGAAGVAQLAGAGVLSPVLSSLLLAGAGTVTITPTPEPGTVTIITALNGSATATAALAGSVSVTAALAASAAITTTLNGMVTIGNAVS